MRNIWRLLGDSLAVCVAELLVIPIMRPLRDRVVGMITERGRCADNITSNDMQSESQHSKGDTGST